MTISTQSRVVQYTGNGVTTVFPFTFPVRDADHLLVQVYNKTDLSVVTLDPSDYTATGVGPASSGGSITYNPLGVPLTSNDLIVIYRQVPYIQDLDIVNQSGFYPETLEGQLDLMVMQVQQLAESVSRALVVPPVAEFTTSEFVTLMLQIANLLDEIEGLYAIRTAISDVAAIDTDVVALASISAAIAALGSITAAITTVAAIDDDVTAVAGISAAITTVAGIASAVSTVAGISANVSTVAGIAADVTTVADNLVDVTNFADVYQGPKAVAPTLRNDGSALQVGDLYFKTTVTKGLQVYDGGAWGPTANTYAVFGASGAGHSTGLVPDPGASAGTAKFLREDATWATPSGGGSEWYNVVTDGGVDNTGATNVHATLAAAIAAAAAANKTAYLPEGLYELQGDVLYITATNVTVVCENENTIIQKSLNSGTQAVHISSAATYLRWYGGKIYYNNVNSTVSGAHCGFWCEASYAHIERVKVYGIFYVGMLIANSTNSNIIDCVSKGAVNRNFYASYGLAIGDCCVTFVNCVADGAILEGSSTKYTNYGFNSNGFGTGYASIIKYIGCTSRYQTSHGFASSERVTGQQYIGCTAHDIAGPGFLVQYANGFSNQRVMFTGCYALRCAQGFWVIDSIFVNFTGCIASIGTSHGFAFSNGQYCNVTGCLSESNAGDGFYTVAAISPSTAINFVGNNSVTNTGWGFSDGATCTKLLYVGNNSTANGAGTYTFGSTAPVTVGNA